MQAAKDNALWMWTVYSSPRDFPSQFVVREWRIVCDGTGRQEAGPIVARSSSLDGCREALDHYLHGSGRGGLEFLYQQRRQDGDEPQIVETWF